MGQTFSDAQLQELAADPGVTSQDIAKLTPQERQRYLELRGGPSQPKPSVSDQITQGATDLFAGFDKGAQETAVNAGKVMRAIPGVGAVTDAIGGSGPVQGIIGKVNELLGGADASQTGRADPKAVMSMPTDDMGLKAENGWQSTGKFAEQLAELYATMGVGGSAASKAAFKLPTAVPTGIRAALTHIIAPAAGQGAIAGADAMLHNDQHPEIAAGLGAAGPLASGTIGMGASMAKNPLFQQLVAILGAGGVGHMVAGGEGAMLGGMGGMMLQQQLRATLRSILRDPNAEQTIARLAREILPRITQTAAASSTALQRRKP